MSFIVLDNPLRSHELQTLDLSRLPTVLWHASLPDPQRTQHAHVSCSGRGLDVGQ